MNRKEDTGDLFGAIARLAEVSKKLGVPVPKLDLKSRHRSPIPHCCPVCGGNWEGDGFSTPIHCERIECPQDREPDADPLPCSTELDASGVCPGCGWTLLGDGIKSPIRCVNPECHEQF